MKRDAVESVYRASALEYRLRAMAAHVRLLQRRAMQEALDAGVRKLDVARASGLTSGRITQITEAGPTVARALEDATGLRALIDAFEADLEAITPVGRAFRGEMVEPPYKRPQDRSGRRTTPAQPAQPTLLEVEVEDEARAS